VDEIVTEIVSIGGFWCERYGTKEKQIMKETLKKESKK
jgi:hypothetical protein